MQTFLFILLIAAMLATVVMLVRGLAIFLLNASENVKGEGGSGPTASALKSNKMMQYRIFFQAIAIVIVVLILFIAGKN